MGSESLEASESAAIPAGAPAIEITGITKRFPGVVANRNVSLTFRTGEIHALLGENGAGKSTLIGMLSGMLQADAGSIRVFGRPARIDAPRRALELGIGTVFQHVTLVPTLSVLQNLMLGGPWHRRLDVDGTRGRLAEVSRRLGVSVKPDAPVGQLSLGQQQQVEIIKALWNGEGVLILDEPTSMLTPQGVEELGRAMVRLRDAGAAVIFITHKLHEAVALADRISVLKLGQVVGEIPPERLRSLVKAEVTAEIVGLMFGAEQGAGAIDGESADSLRRRSPLDAALAPVLAVVGLSTVPRAGELPLKSIDFAVRPGEIFGIAGVDGNGQKQLAEVIAGQRQPSAGDVRLAGRSVLRLGVGGRQRLGLRYVTDDRLNEGTVGNLPVSLNFVLKRVGEAPFWQNGFAREARIKGFARELIRRHDVRTPSESTPIGRLSGGNTQKALLARELAGEPRAVVFNKPTYGLDVQNIRAARRHIRAQADAGVAVVLISTDLDELVALCDRIGVMLMGELKGIVGNGSDAARQVGQLMVGAGAA